MDRTLIYDRAFPETQVYPPYPIYSNDIIGSIFVTGGFMEPNGHGLKSKMSLYLNRNSHLLRRNAGNYNIGFDYCIRNGNKIKAFFSGKVIRAGLEGNYGYRIHIKLNLPLLWRGRAYPAYQAYAHCDRLYKSKDELVTQGEVIGIQGGTGAGGITKYPPHVDFDSYAFINNSLVHFNFELLNKSIKDIVIGDLLVKPIANTTIKGEFKQAKDIKDPNLKFDYSHNAKPLKANWLKDRGDHWEFELKFPIKGKFNWFAFKHHVTIIYN